MTRDTIWQTAAVSQAFLENVRGAIPLAAEQIDVMLRVIQAARPSVANFLDLGCRDGILGQAILKKCPRALGVFLDFSESMIEAARNRCGPRAEKLEFITQDFGKKEWVNSVGGSPFDVIVSGFAIHHQPDVRKKEIYREIYHLLKPGGIFLNLEHVSSSSELSSEISDELFIDHLYGFHQAKSSGKSREQIAQDFYHRPDKVANILAPVEAQCNWLRDFGFMHVDCFMKLFELAVFGGIRPEHG